MVLCPNGSSAKPSSPPYAWITWVEGQQWLGSLFPKFQALLYALQPVLVNITTACATEPAQPVYPGDAVVAAMFLNPISFAEVFLWLKDSLLWWQWSQLCQCNASATPGCQTLLTSEASNLPTGGAGNNYWYGIDLNTIVGGLTLWAVDIDVEVVGPVGIAFEDVPTTFLDQYSWTPSGTGWQRFTLPTPRLLTSGQSYKVILDAHTGTFRAYYVSPFTWPTVIGSVNYANETYATALGGPWTPQSAKLGINPVICTASPNTYDPAPPSSPTTLIPDLPTASCTTVGDLCALFQPTMAATSVIGWQTNLLQQRLLPFAWVLGTAHTGLTGTGSISVQDILGVLVSFTTIPSGWGQTFETPGRRIPSLGSIQADDGTNYTDNFQLHYPDQIIMLSAPWATAVRYNFRGGIVATITPILPQP